MNPWHGLPAITYPAIHVLKEAHVSFEIELILLSALWMTGGLFLFNIGTSRHIVQVRLQLWLLC